MWTGSSVTCGTFEVKGVGLERIAEYCSLERETQNYQASRWLSCSWPGIYSRHIPCEMAKPWFNHCYQSQGKLWSNPDILHGVSFTVQSGQRVGIVGATGCGKSNLAKAFLSFVEITNGKIKNDGRGLFTQLIRVYWSRSDIENIPLGLVRSRLGIIAQDPILLSCSLS